MGRNNPSVARSLARSPQAVAHRAGGPPCRTCGYAERARVEAECAEWNRLRRRKLTIAPWSMLHQALRSELPGYPVSDWRSLTRHLERCLGWTIH